MPTPLPAASAFTGASVTEGQFKTALTELRTFLSDLLGTDGTSATARNALGLGTAQTPTFAGVTTTGAITAGGQFRAADGTASAPAYTFTGDTDTGIYHDQPNEVAIATSGVERVRFATASAFMRRALDDTASYTQNFQKARGTVASPTAITTADVLGTIAGDGYVGATGGYVTASRIRFESTGTISDASTGLGGMITFWTRVSGSGLTQGLHLDDKNNLVQSVAGVNTNATDGFIYAESCGGTPTGTPTAYSNRVPMVFDRTNKVGYAYQGAWINIAGQVAGWAAATGTATRTTFATGSVTTAQLAERVKGLLDDLIGLKILTA